MQAALAMATPEQIQQALMALAQAANASAGGQLKPEDLQALFGPQWASLVAMPGGPISLPPDQLQLLAASEAPHALTHLVQASSSRMLSWFANAAAVSCSSLVSAAATMLYCNDQDPQ